MREASELPGALERCRSEALRAFGDGRVYVEELLPRARHVEVQLLGDGHDVLHLGDRDCSVQRARQKLLEIAPAAGLPDGLRFDVVVVNEPYVPTAAIATMPSEARDHEPRTALDGGPDGVDLHRRVAAGVREWLSPGGSLVVETSRDQAPLTVAACEAAGLAAYVVTDDERDATAVVGTAP